MYTTALLLAAASLSLVRQVAGGSAVATSDNPTDAVYTASTEEAFFADAALPGTLAGSIVAQTPRDGRGVTFDVNFDNLPSEGGPFTYHIHEEAVPEDGNCTETGAHLDPYGAGTDAPCDPEKPQDCEVGDLSGKHGSVDTLPFAATYNDLYLSTDESQPSFLGNVSFVVHYANGTRLACANFSKLAPCSGKTNSASSSSSPSSSPSGTPTADASSAQSSTSEDSDPDSGAAAQMTVVSTAVVAGLAAAVAALVM
ncbi:Copper/zinc superoxide dismutase (SODC) [Geosmithia morbida]|uniref:superoxide dismutase n=1 Tax=Geosmithia morbida TaxID=1094350 RepID=A0A9P4YY41_9HYPO|nr:Copper/zinc superoxide dismutase (SODC) [Geosmithia morbida]KAF4123924.1 Copper/zinc superoxide dismutase (SODC) [Geosmithia morbida]